MREERKFETFNGINYRFDLLELPQSLKFVGLPIRPYSDKKGREKFQNEYAALVNDKAEPYTEIALWENLTSDDGMHDWVYGCLVNSLENIPTGLVGIDTGWTRILVMTVKYDDADTLFKKIRKTHNNFHKMIPPEYSGQVLPPAPGSTRGFSIIGGAKPSDTSLVEIYRYQDLFEKFKMCFYIPLKS